MSDFGEKSIEHFPMLDIPDNPECRKQILGAFLAIGAQLELRHQELEVNEPGKLDPLERKLDFIEDRGQLTGMSLLVGWALEQLK